MATIRPSETAYNQTLGNQYGVNVRIADYPLRTGLSSQKSARAHAPGVLRLLYAELRPK